MKLWNIKKNYRDMASFELEQELSKELKFAYFSCSNYLDYAKKAFESIWFSTDVGRTCSALEHIEEAIRLDREGFIYSAELEIKKVFLEP